MGRRGGVVANDFTALSVALPAIEKQFDTDVGTVQWVINAYALTFGVLIVVGGRLADLFGRKRIFMIGAAIFAGFSVIGGAAQDTALLIACRALMGIGGAMMWPAILGMTYAVLPDSKAGLAGGLILGAAGIGNAVGPLFGGVLTDTLELALDLLRQPPDRRARGAGDAGWRSTRRARADRPPDRLRRRGDAVARDSSRCWSRSIRRPTGAGATRAIIALLVLCVVMLVALRARSSGGRASGAWSRAT